jgi:hypothetical protein
MFAEVAVSRRFASVRKMHLAPKRADRSVCQPKLLATLGSDTPPGPTTQSNSNGDFLTFGDKARINGLAHGCLVSASGQEDPAAISAPLSLGVKFRFPETETAAARDSVRMRRLLGGKAEHLWRVIRGGE